MVYNFALPPLVLYTFYPQDTTFLCDLPTPTFGMVYASSFKGMRFLLQRIASLTFPPQVLLIRRWYLLAHSIYCTEADPQLPTGVYLGLVFHPSINTNIGLAGIGAIKTTPKVHFNR